MDHSSFLRPSSDGRLGCLHLLAVVNHVAMDMCVHVFVGTAFCSCFGSVSRSGIPRPHSHFMFNLLRKACPPFLAPFLKKHRLRSSHCRIDQGPPPWTQGNLAPGHSGGGVGIPPRVVAATGRESCLRHCAPGCAIVGVCGQNTPLSRP